MGKDAKEIRLYFGRLPNPPTPQELSENVWFVWSKVSYSGKVEVMTDTDSPFQLIDSGWAK